MSNPLHDLGDVFHRFGEEIKALADKLEAAFKKEEAPVVAEAETAAETVAQDAVKAAETAATESAPGA